MAVDFYMPFGSDMVWTAQEAPQLVTDVPGNPAATQQQTEVLVLTSPRLLDVNGVGVGRPDNWFYPDRGGGLRAIVGVNPLPQYINAMKARILAGLSSSANIAPTPAPTVTTQVSNGTLTVTVSAYTNDGELVQVSQSTSTGG